MMKPLRILFKDDAHESHELPEKTLNFTFIQAVIQSILLIKKLPEIFQEVSISL